MAKLQRKLLGGSVAAMAAFTVGGQVMADPTPLDRFGNGSLLTMENDSDTYTPTNNNPLADNPGDPVTTRWGQAPGKQPTPNTRLDGIFPGEPDTVDLRFTTGRQGLVEEVANGHLNGLGNPVSAGDGSAHFAIMQPAGRYQEALAFAYGPAFRVGSEADGQGGVTNNQPYTLGQYSAQIDIFLDPFVSSGNHSIMWQSGVSNASNGYYAAQGINIVSNANGTFSFTNQAGATLASSIADDQWVTLETLPFDWGGNQLGFLNRIWSMDGQLLGQAFADSTEGQLASGAAGPRFPGWFLNQDIPYLYIDNVGFAAPLPEPGSLALLGLGSLAALRRRRQA